MTARPLSKQSLDDLMWLCRRLAHALEAGEVLVRALGEIARRAPARKRPLIEAIRHRVAAGGRMSDELIDRSYPSYVTSAVRTGEASATLSNALTLLADRLELERGIQPGRDRALHSYALAFGRLGMLAPILGTQLIQALESAAASVAPSSATESLMAAHKAIIAGDGFSDALERAAPDLPRTAVEMIRDGENDHRLREVLPIVADYLLDEAGQQPTRRSRKEKSHA